MPHLTPEANLFVAAAAGFFVVLWVAGHLAYMDRVRPRRRARRAWGVERPSVPAQVAGGLAEILRRVRDDLVRWGTR